MKTIIIITTISIGILFPFTHNFAFLIKYLLMIMLFFSFLKMETRKEHFTKNHLYLTLANVVIPIVLFLLIKQFSLSLAEVIFITAIAPTAIASPIIINILKGNIEFTVISIVVSNFSIAFLLPFLLPLFLNSGSSISTLDILTPVSMIILIPFFTSMLIKKYLQKIKDRLSELGKYVFYVLMLNINLGTAKASNYIKEEMSFTDPIILQIAISSLILCIIFFSIGKRLVPKNLILEGGQSLGQKNNGFTVWLALTFISPLAVLGPVFYILFQNIYISWQLHKNGKVK